MIGILEGELLTVLANNGIGVVCAIAVLWLGWYSLTKAFPRMLETFAQIIKEERVFCQKMHDENRDRLDKIILESKEQRHLTLNLANQLGLKSAVEKEMSKRTQIVAPPDEQ